MAAWNGRGNLQQLVDELNRQKESRLDVVIEGRHLRVDEDRRLKPNTLVAQEWLPKDGLLMRDRALVQLGSRMKPEVPGKFIKELADQKPAIAGSLLTNLLTTGNGNKHLVRCLDGQVRAVLSNQYRVLDNFDLAFTALEVAQQNGGEIIECVLTETNMRLKFTTRSVFDAIVAEKAGGADHKFLYQTGLPQGRDGWGPHGQLPGGPGTVHPVVTISNSETGHGGTHIQLGIIQAICVNMAIMESVQSHIHLGSSLEAGVYEDETITADSKAIMLKCQDSIKAAFQPERFKKLVSVANGAATDKLDNPIEAVNHLVKAVDLSEAAKDGILAHFLKDYDSTRYGLAQAVARYSQQVEDGDSAHDFEALAGRVMGDRKLVHA